MINLQFDIGPTLCCVYHPYTVQHYSARRLPKCNHFETWLSETGQTRQSVTHAMSRISWTVARGLYSRSFSLAALSDHSILPLPCACASAYVSVVYIKYTQDTNKKIYFGHETYIIGKFLTRLLPPPDVYTISCNVKCLYPTCGQPVTEAVTVTVA